MEAATTRGIDGLQLWIRELERYPPLDQEEQDRLARAFRQGDQAAGERLVLHSLRFAFSCAREAEAYGSLPLEEFVGAANLAVWEALTRFDPDRGMSFCGWARYHLRERLREVALELAHPVRLPAHALRQGAIIHEADEEWLDRIPSNQAEPADDLTRTELLRSVQDALCTLEDEERQVLEQLHGLSGRRALSLRETGRLLGLSVERTAQLRDRGLAKLRSGPSAERLRALWEAGSDADPYEDVEASICYPTPAA